MGVMKVLAASPLYPDGGILGSKQWQTHTPFFHHSGETAEGSEALEALE